MFMKKKGASRKLIHFGLFLLILVLVFGAIFVYRAAMYARNTLETGVSDTSGTVSITIVPPDASSDSAVTGQVTLTVVEGER